LFGFNPVKKPQHGRNKPKRGNLTAITDKVRQEVNRRSEEFFGQGCPLCERCGSPYGLTKAHLVNASQGGSGAEPWNLANLCGTHGTGGCHEFADNCKEGKAWKEAKRSELIKYYTTGEGRKHWEG
jgi:hypothetical protein